MEEEEEEDSVSYGAPHQGLLDQNAENTEQNKLK